MKCSICNKPIVLYPSAEERSVRYGQPASYYRSLFTEHAQCKLDKRRDSTLELIRRLSKKDQIKR